MANADPILINPSLFRLGGGSPGLVGKHPFGGEHPAVQKQTLGGFLLGSTSFWVVFVGGVNCRRSVGIHAQRGATQSPRDRKLRRWRLLPPRPRAAALAGHLRKRKSRCLSWSVFWVAFCCPAEEATKPSWHSPSIQAKNAPKFWNGGGGHP